MSSRPAWPRSPSVAPALGDLLSRLSSHAPTAQAWLPPAVRDLADSYAAEGGATHLPQRPNLARRRRRDGVALTTRTRFGDVRLYALNLSHFLGLDRRLPDTSSRDLARILWRTIEQFIETAKDLEPIRPLSDAHARNVAKAFAEASAALSAAADVNVPGAGSIFGDHN